VPPSPSSVIQPIQNLLNAIRERISNGTPSGVFAPANGKQPCRQAGVKSPVSGCLKMWLSHSCRWSWPRSHHRYQNGRLGGQRYRFLRWNPHPSPTRKHGCCQVNAGQIKADQCLKEGLPCSYRPSTCRRHVAAPLKYRVQRLAKAIHCYRIDERQANECPAWYLPVQATLAALFMFSH